VKVLFGIPVFLMRKILVINYVRIEVWNWKGESSSEKLEK
jgi:hypothetical protein